MSPIIATNDNGLPEIRRATTAPTIPSGMFGAAELCFGAAQTSWSVPFESVLDANDNEGFVFITNDQKRAIKQPVIIESFDGNTIRISKGLEESNSLIISGSAYLADNSPIIITK